MVPAPAPGPDERPGSGEGALPSDVVVDHPENPAAAVVDDRLVRAPLPVDIVKRALLVHAPFAGHFAAGLAERLRNSLERSQVVSFQPDLGVPVASLLRGPAVWVPRTATVGEAARVMAALNDSGVQAIVTTGGTGVTSRDGTYEAVSRLLEKRLDGFGELFRMLSYHDIGPAAMMSRATAGTIRGRIIVSLPGSEAAVRLALTKLLLPELGHLVQQVSR